MNRPLLYLKRAKEVLTDRGYFYLVRTGFNIMFQRFEFGNTLINSVWQNYYRAFNYSKKFTFQNTEYNYFYHKYNTTWESERAVEIPIIWHIVKEHKGKNILEVGNVLSHYFNVEHDILDKYEKGRGVINEDVINFSPKKKYDLIVSISTLEHVGFDEFGGRTGNPTKSKSVSAINSLKNALAKKGKLIFTFPWGYNQHLDKLVKNNKIKLSKRLGMKRISKDNQWAECSFEEVSETKFGKPYSYANGLVIGIYSTNKINRVNK